MNYLIRGKITMAPQHPEIEILQIQTNYQPDPTMIFNQLCKEKKFSLLLESAEVNKKRDLESMIILDTAIRISALNNVVTLQSFTENGKNVLLILDEIWPKTIKMLRSESTRKIIFPIIKHNIDEDQKLNSASVFDIFRLLIKTFHMPKNCSKAMFFGGLFAYDLVNSFEILPQLENNQKCPDFCFYLAETLLILDHQKQTCIIQSSLFKKDTSEKDRLKRKLQKLKYRLTQDFPTPEIISTIPMVVKYNQTDEQYIEIVEKMQKAIKKGDIFQVVPSRKFYLPCLYPLLAYRRLKKSNPSPYMFFMQDSDFTLFGASPESSLKYNSHNRQIEIYPIAGTRSRGKTKTGLLDLDLDNRIELEMRMDLKELSEHLMLVDLARNDLARICEPGSRYVADLTNVDRYSCVMHLVSRVIGKLRNNLDVFHAYCACMNMGTLTGSPKIKAMELIATVENEKRGSYGGAIGYFTGTEMFDTCIVIRAAYVENKIATVQAGAGIVLDSIPQSEANESRNKARAVLDAIIYSHTKKKG